MKIVLDTNVFVSAIFFSGPPYRIIRAWREGMVRVAYSPAIILEYRRVLADLSQQFPNINPKFL
jgi:predicted nucleic acid-binding protein